MLGHLARHDIVLSDLLALVVLASLLLLEGLQAHPIRVAVSLALIYHILLHLITAVEVAHVGHFLSFINLLLHQPIIHRFSTVFVLVPLQLCHIEELFFDLVLRLVDQLTFESLLGIFGFQPVLVGDSVFVQMVATLRKHSRLLRACLAITNK